MSHEPKKTERQGVLDALRRSVRRLEAAGSTERPHLPLGVPEIDRVLPGGGLRLGRIHEVGGDEAATGFCAALLARVAETDDAAPGALLWLARGEDLYPPGLVRYGIAAGRLRVVSGLRRGADALWALEEALRCRAVCGVVAEVDRVDPTAGRRLTLAAEGTAALALALARGREVGGRRSGRCAAAASRWRVTGHPVGEARTPRTRWRVELLHCRGGRPTDRIVDWDGGAWSARPSPTKRRRTP